MKIVRIPLHCSAQEMMWLVGDMIYKDIVRFKIQVGSRVDKKKR